MTLRLTWRSLLTDTNVFSPVVDGNDLTGNVPTEMGLLTGLTSLWLGEYSLLLWEETFIVSLTLHVYLLYYPYQLQDGTNWPEISTISYVQMTLIGFTLIRIATKKQNANAAQCVVARMSRSRVMTIKTRAWISSDLTFWWISTFQLFGKFLVSALTVLNRTCFSRYQSRIHRQPMA